LAFTCGCGIATGLKFVLRAEGSSDYADILLSLKYFPNVVSSDLAPRIALTTNLRAPSDPPFHPNEGKFAEGTPGNIEAAKRGELVVDLPWLKCPPKNPPDPDCHPVTGSADHYAALDTLHDKNWKADIHRLRSLILVPQLAGRLNSQCVEQLNSELGRNNYFLNMMGPSTQIFSFRLLLELRNDRKNQKHRKTVQQNFPDERLLFDKFGRLCLESLLTAGSDDASPGDGLGRDASPGEGLGRDRGNSKYLKKLNQSTTFMKIVPKSITFKVLKRGDLG
jgi:hypothetical protein